MASSWRLSSSSTGWRILMIVPSSIMVIRRISLSPSTGRRMHLPCRRGSLFRAPFCRGCHWAFAHRRAGDRVFIAPIISLAMFSIHGDPASLMEGETLHHIAQYRYWRTRSGWPCGTHFSLPFQSICTRMILKCPGIRERQSTCTRQSFQR